MIHILLFSTFEIKIEYIIVIDLFREEMITWSEEIRNKDYTYFCKAAIRYEINHLHF